MSRPFALALFLSQCLVHLLQQTLHLREVWLEVPRFPEVQSCGGELSLLHVELAEQQKHFSVARGQERQALEIVNCLRVLATLEREERQLIERFYLIGVAFYSLGELLACLRGLALLEP